ncbi:MAG: DNA-processing protein DprA [Clostridia bacterium]|nr:DNA-processing protein DprA [Clostridia bacterium]
MRKESIIIIIQKIMENNYDKYWIWFSRIKKLNVLQKRELLRIYQSPEKIWMLNKAELFNIRELDNQCIEEILNEEYRKNIEKYIEYMRKNNIIMITINDKLYPNKLKELYDKPVVLFAKGNINLMNNNCVAIVGSRECTEYGKNEAQKLSYELAKNNMCIVSGLARGIDKYAHIGAIKAKGNTIAVIGNGLDNIYPYENQKLAERIIENNGLIVTEYIVGTKPDKINFPARNRIISGLSDGIVVVEAKEKSGALITADFGLEQGKEIFAVPGNINCQNSVGTNRLIQDGANIVISYKDIENPLKKLKKDF